ncbi:MAG: phosphatidate phosphatase APP1 [Mariniblastus sp.]|jgi:phosphatidate phosphatase APP1
MIKIGGSKDSTSVLMPHTGFGYRDSSYSDAANSDLKYWRIHISGVAWQAPVVFTMRQRMMIRMLGGVMQATPDQLGGEMFKARITPFMVEADDKQVILVTINDRKYRLKKRTRRNGHFGNWIHVAETEIDSATEVIDGHAVVRFSVSMEGQPVEAVQGSVFLYRPSGISVVSDIDDTIKDSDVGDRRELLVNTFLREFRSIEGMADAYRNWAQAGASFHYVSSSPWQLYQSLQQMHTVHGFPLGTMHLRNFRLRDQLLKRVMLRRKGKATAIQELMRSMPNRNFVLVGDSGEKDPKIYKKICRQFQGRVKAVFIRELAHRRIESEAREKLTRAVQPHGVFGTFTSAEELLQLSDGLFAAKV